MMSSVVLPGPNSKRSQNGTYWALLPRPTWIQSPSGPPTAEWPSRPKLDDHQFQIVLMFVLAAYPSASGRVPDSCPFSSNHGKSTVAGHQQMLVPSDAALFPVEINRTSASGLAALVKTIFPVAASTN